MHIEKKINKNEEDDKNSSFPNLIKKRFEKIINSNKYIREKNDFSIQKCFIQLLENIYYNGTYSQSKKIFKIFNKFLKKEISNRMNDKKFCELFKNIYVLLMNTFNNNYKKGNKEISIKKYLIKSEKDGEKIGGTIKTVYEEYAKNISNFKDLLNYKINDFNNIILLDFLSLLLNKRNRSYFWDYLGNIIEKYSDYIDLSIFSEYTKDLDIIHENLIDYINYKLFFLNINDLNILVQFMYNISDYFLNDLYPKKLIYFLPEDIIINIKDIIYIVNEITEISKEIIENDNNSPIESELSKNFQDLCKKCCHQYISIYIKIISDNNIKKPTIKCSCLDNIREYIYLDEYFTDDELYSIFNFIYLVHNKFEYKNSVLYFISIFDNDMNNQELLPYNLGKRLNNIFSKNINFLRILIIILYNSVNESLSELEEAFSEYNFIPRTSQNQFNQNINNNFNQNILYSGNNIIVINHRNFNNNQINQNHIEMLNRALNDGIPIEGRRLIVISELQNNDINDTNKLLKIENALNKVKLKILKLNNFYKLTSKIKELYQINTFESKKLYNLLLSLYNLLFSKNNIDKIENNKNDNNINLLDSYCKSLKSINDFYNILINNIIEINDENILKEISKLRNIMHFKEILEIFEKFNPSKVENDYKIMKDFIAKLEQLIPDEELVKNNNIREQNQNNKENSNICSIC